MPTMPDAAPPGLGAPDHASKTKDESNSCYFGLAARLTARQASQHHEARWIVPEKSAPGASGRTKTVVVQREKDH